MSDPSRTIAFQGALGAYSDLAGRTAFPAMTSLTEDIWGMVRLVNGVLCLFVFEAIGRFDPTGRHDVIVNLQGDLPMVEPAALSAVLGPLADAAVDIATLAIEIDRKSVV